MIQRSENITKNPYWWEDAEPVSPADEFPQSKQDVIVIGGGYTGLSAALTLAKAGSSVVVVEAEVPGFGASSRNGGMVGNMLKPGLGGLIQNYGLDKGKAIYSEAIASVDFIRTLIKQEEINCDLKLNGRFYPAILTKHLKSMEAECVLREQHFDLGEEIVGKGGCQEDVASDIYVGGLRQFHTGGLHPAKFAKGLAAAVKKHGGVILAPCRALRINRQEGDFVVETSSGILRSNELLIATNGYNSDLFPFVQKRIIPIGSTMIATEALPKEQVSALFPTSRMITDTRKMLSYYRPSPDGTRVLLGGRPTVFKASPEIQAQALKRRLAEIFPSLSTVPLSHVWTGNVAYGFDALPTIGKHEGIYYAMGYCGSGVAMSGYLGQKVASKMLKSSDGETAFDDLAFPDRFYYNGNPWFLPIAMIGYRLRDHFGF